MQVESYNTERALRKIKRHPDPVVDVSKDTGMGVRSLSMEMEKTRLKIEDGKVNRSDDMEIETHSLKKTGSRLGDAKFKSFIGGPSCW